MKPTKAFYAAAQGKTVKVGRFMCTVSQTTTESRSGSWERGFKFSKSTWAVLRRKLKSRHYAEVSMDHGKTWHATLHAAKRSKGKLKLSTETHGEFAFEGIQAINRAYDPAYKWRP